jgi:hypothetical protein
MARPAVRISDPKYQNGITRPRTRAPSAHAAKDARAVGAGLERWSGGQPQQDRVDEDRDSELDADHGADDGCGDDGECGEHNVPPD